MSLNTTRVSALLLILATGGGLVSCTTDQAPDGNIFLNRRPPRYGHGGTENPRYKYGATETREKPAADRQGDTKRGETKYLAEQRNDRPSRPRVVEDEPSREDTSRRDRDRDRDRDRNSSRDREDTTSGAVANTDDAGSSPSRPEPKPEPKPPVAEDIPYATPVPGREGQVYSPYHSSGYVDVTGMKSGEKARCPYTKKIFRVP